MDDPNVPEFPVEHPPPVSESAVMDLFELLGNETRMTILLALWEAIEPFTEGEGDPSTFSELRDRVGMPDSGQFNYHLDKLEGKFIERRDEGYKLRPIGERIIRTIIAIAGYDRESFGPTEIDFACPECGAPTAVTYENQRLYHVCTACEGTYELGERDPSGVLSSWSMYPSAIRGRTAEEAYSAVGTLSLHHGGLWAAGICYWCSGEMASRLHICEDHQPGEKGGCPVCGTRYNPAVWGVCSVCKHRGRTNLPQWSLNHPAIVAFYREHGIELGYDRYDLDTARWRWALNDRVDEEVISTDPPRARITFTEEGESIQLTYDEDLDVVQVVEER